MGHSHMQYEVCRVTGGLFISYFGSLGQMVRVGGEMNIEVSDPVRPAVVVPDLYVLEDEPQSGPKVSSWKPAEHGGKVPTLALEVVSDSYQKDYDQEEALARYQQLGVPEVVRYDPDWANHRRTKYPRRLLTHFVRSAEGTLEQQPDVGRGDRVLIKRYRVWLIHQPPYVLRLATGTLDDLHIWPTETERARTEAARANTEAERAHSEAARAREAEERAHTEAARAQTAEERIRALEEELTRLRKS